MITPGQAEERARGGLPLAHVFSSCLSLLAFWEGLARSSPWPGEGRPRRGLRGHTVVLTSQSTDVKLLNLHSSAARGHNPISQMLCEAWRGGLPPGATKPAAGGASVGCLLVISVDVAAARRPWPQLLPMALGGQMLAPLEGGISCLHYRPPFAGGSWDSQVAGPYVPSLLGALALGRNPKATNLTGF